MPSNIQSSLSRIDDGKMLYSSLIALGLNPCVLEQKEKLVINEHVFKKISQKIGDFLLHFLYVIIDPQYSSQVFRDCWPIYDKKTESQFRNACFDWLKQLCQNDDFNLKPSLVVSKATVTPTSHKFLSTLQTLIRIALIISISRKDSNSLLHLPTLADTPDRRVISMKIINCSKLKHCRRFTSKNLERLRNMQCYQEKSNELVARYRSLFVQQDDSMNNILKRIAESPCIDQKLKNKYKNVHSFDGASFRNEIESIMIEKNDELKPLWTNLERLKKKDENVWPFLSALISGDISLTCIDGCKYKQDLLSTVDDPVISKLEKSLLYVEENLDLLSLFKLHQNLLRKQLEDLKQKNESKMNHNYSGVAEETMRLQKCVSSLLKNFKEISTQTSYMYPSIFQEANDIRQKLEKFNEFFEAKHQDTFDLCPPSPAIYSDCNVETADSTFYCASYTQHPLTPTGEKSIQMFPRKLCSDVSSPNLSQILLKKKHLQAINAISPSNKHSITMQTQNVEKFCGTLNNATISSNHHFTQDSGCIITSGNFSESLSHTLEKIDITPKDKVSRNIQNHSDTLKTEVEIIKFDSDILSPVYSSLTLDNSVFNTCNESANNNSSIYNNTSQNYANDLVFDDLCESSNITPQRPTKCIAFNVNDISSSIPSDVREVSNRNDELSMIRSHTSRNSPIVTKLLTELDNSPINKSLKRVFKGTSGLTKITPNKATIKDFGKRLMKDTEPISGFSLSCVASSPNFIAAPKIDKADIQENYSMCMSSLESMLGPAANYDFNTDFTSSKDLLYQEDSSYSVTERFYDSTSIFGQHLLNPSIKYLLNDHLPKGSVFETLTESIAAGELEQCSILNEEIMDEVKRESLLVSRRDSILSLGQRSNGQSPRLSEAFQLRSKTNYSNILDESDSCLLSSSIEDF